jgi:hypothetical protein
MDFKVITDAEGSYEAFHDDAEYKVLDGGALEVSPNSQDLVERRIVFGPAGWFRVVVTKV